MRPDAQRQFLDFTGSLIAQRPRVSKETAAVADAIGCPCMTDEICDRKGECFCKTGADAVIALTKAGAA